MMSDERILIIDDNPSMVEICAQILAAEGYQVYKACGGPEALTQLEREQFDLLVLDLRMPKVDGMTVLRRARELDPDVTAIVITSYGSMENAIEALRAGAWDFLLKPFTPDDLVRAAGEALAARRQEQERLLLRARLPILEISHRFGSGTPQALAVEGDVETLAERLLEVVVSQIGAEQAALLVLDQEADELHVAAAAGRPDENMAGRRFPAGEGIARQALLGQEPLVLEVSSPATRGDPLRPVLNAGPDTAAVCVPLRTGEKAIGLLTLSRAERAGSAPFSPAELNLLSIMGSQITNALENARLYEAFRRELAERKRAEEQVLVANERLHYLLSTSPATIYTAKTSGDHGATFMSENVTQMVGYEPREFLEETSFWIDRVHPDDLHKVSQAVPLVFEKELHAYEYRFKGKDGTYIWVRDEMKLVRDEAEEPLEIIGYWLDITERKQAEAAEELHREALRESDERHRNLFERVPVGLYITTPDGQILDANSALLEMLGFPDQDTALAANAASTYANPKDRVRWQATMEREGLVRDFEAQWRRRDGTRIWVKDTARAVADGEGRVLYYEGSLEDITERKQAEAAEELHREALQRRAEELAALQATVLEITIPHDLPTLLQTIVERATLLLNALGGGLYLCDPDQEQARCVVSYNTPHDYTGTVLKYGEGAAGTVAKTAEPLIIDDYRAWSSRAGAFDEDQPFTAVLSAPMIWQGQVTGVVHVLHEMDSRRFTQADLDLLILFANHAAIAVENARLYEEALQEIAERKRAESQRDATLAALRESEGRMRLALEGTDQGLWDWDVVSGAITFDDNWLRVLGYTPGEMEFDFAWWERSIHPDSTPVFEAELNAYLEGRQKYLELEYQIKNKSGEWRWIWSRGVCVAYGEQGEPLRMIGTHRDITERVRAEEALRESEGMIRTILDTNPDTIHLLDSNGIILSSNKGFAGRIGLRVDDVVGKSVFDYTPTESVPNRKALLNKVFETGEPAQIEDKGLTGVFESHVHPVLNPAGEVTSVAVYAHDITERRKAEAALRRSLEETARGQRLLLALSQAAQAVLRARTAEEIYRTIGDEVVKLGHHAVVFALTHNQQYLTIPHLTVKPSVLRAAEKLTGLSLQTFRVPLVRSPVFQRVLTAGEASFDEPTADFLAGGLPKRVRSLAPRIAGMLGWGQCITAPLTVSGETIGLLLVAGPDLTEADVAAVTAFANQAAIALENTRLVEEARTRSTDLEKLSVRLYKAQEEERRRISLELHDELGQALTAMGFDLAAIERELPPEAAPKARERLASVSSLLAEVDERVSEMALDLRPQMLDDLGLLPTLRWYVNRYTRRMGIDVELEAVDFEQRLTPDVATAVYRTVQEALTNVAKHAGASRVAVRLERTESTVTAVVQDNGRGFEAEEFTAHLRERGAGLLGIQERVALLGGGFDIHSRPGQGTRLTIRIPI